MQLDSAIVLSTIQDTLIHVYNNKGHFIGSFGRKGRGPAEFRTPPLIKDGVSQNSTLMVFVNDFQSMRLHKIDLKASLDSNKTIIRKNYRIPNKLRGYSEMYYTGPHKFVGMYDDHSYKQLDGRRGGFKLIANSDSITTFSLFNLNVKPSKVMPEININARVTAISPDRKRIAFLMINYPGIEVYTIDSAKLNRYLLKADPPQLPLMLRIYRKTILQIIMIL